MQGAAAAAHCAIAEPVERCSTNTPASAMTPIVIAATVHTRLATGRCQVGASWSRYLLPEARVKEGSVSETGWERSNACHNISLIRTRVISRTLARARRASVQPQAGCARTVTAVPHVRFCTLVGGFADRDEADSGCLVQGCQYMLPSHVTLPERCSFPAHSRQTN